MMDGLYALMDQILPTAIFGMKFMKNALLALLLLTPLLALLGTMAVNRRMAFFSDALGHSALAGAGAGMLLGASNQTAVLIVFGVLWALLISRINRTGGASADTNISVFLHRHRAGADPAQPGRQLCACLLPAGGGRAGHRPQRSAVAGRRAGGRAHRLGAAVQPPAAQRRQPAAC